jgi:hypothetical protein
MCQPTGTDMSKKEVAAIEWLDIETLKHLLATPRDHKTMTKPRAGRNIRGIAECAEEQRHAAKDQSCDEITARTQ